MHLGYGAGLVLLQKDQISAGRVRANVDVLARFRGQIGTAALSFDRIHAPVRVLYYECIRTVLRHLDDGHSFN